MYSDDPPSSSTNRGSARPTIVWSSMAGRGPDRTAARSRGRRPGGSGGGGATFESGHVTFDMSREAGRVRPVSLRHAVLGLLAGGPMRGYELARRFDLSLSNAWHARHSQIYPELAKLEDLGLVEVVEEGARRSRTFGVTEAGREELRRFMTETEPVRTQRSETGVRWFLMFLLDPEDRRVVLEREIAFLEAQAEGLRALYERIDAAPQPQPFRPTVDLGLRVNAVMREWLTEQLDATG